MGFEQPLAVETPVTYINPPTFMVSEGSCSTDSIGSYMQPPKFMTNKTNKSRYAVKLRGWINMTGQFAVDDRKMKGTVKNAGYIMYMSCDDQVRDRLVQAESNLVINLKGDDTANLDRVVLVDEIITIIAHESVNDMICRQVGLLSSIYY